MNKRIDFTKLGGYPLAQEDLDFMQVSYRAAFAAIAGMIGDKVIISGMTPVGGDITAGWIALNGELIPFSAGTVGTGAFLVEEITDSLTFDDGETKPVLITKVARFSVGGAYSYNDLVRLSQVKTGLVPVGGIIMWSGAANALPAGYALCDGVAGRPNLSGKFVVGLNPADPDFNVIGKTGGAKQVSLLTANLPPIQIQLPEKRNDVDRGGEYSQWSLDNVQTLNIGGTSQAFSILVPYYTIAYIIRIA